MALLTPATGAQISFGKVNKAFTNFAPGAAGNAPSGGQNIKLSSVLGTYVSLATGTQLSLSLGLGGKSTPFDYDT
jgi:hypothetical protein